jgi:hypothetical protein
MLATIGDSSPIGELLDNTTGLGIKQRNDSGGNIKWSRVCCFDLAEGIHTSHGSNAEA